MIWIFVSGQVRFQPEIVLIPALQLYISNLKYPNTGPQQ